jgi:hypothetical protein
MLNSLVYKALQAKGCFIWPDTQWWFNLCPDADEFETYSKCKNNNLYIGFTLNCRFIAVLDISEHKPDVYEKPLCRFFNIVNGRQGLAFIAGSENDVKWHFFISNALLGVLNKDVFEKAFIAGMRICIRAIKKESARSEDDQTYLELLDSALNHQDYEIESSFRILSKRKMDLTNIYGNFLQFYRPIITDYIRNRDSQMKMFSKQMYGEGADICNMQ